MKTTWVCNWWPVTFVDKPKETDERIRACKIIISLATFFLLVPTFIFYSSKLFAHARTKPQQFNHWLKMKQIQNRVSPRVTATTKLNHCMMPFSKPSCHVSLESTEHCQLNTFLSNWLNLVAITLHCRLWSILKCISLQNLTWPETFPVPKQWFNALRIYRILNPLFYHTMACGVKTWLHSPVTGWQIRRVKMILRDLNGSRFSAYSWVAFQWINRISFHTEPVIGHGWNFLVVRKIKSCLNFHHICSLHSTKSNDLLS